MELSHFTVQVNVVAMREEDSPVTRLGCTVVATKDYRTRNLKEKAEFLPKPAAVFLVYHLQRYFHLRDISGDYSSKRVGAYK